jgi:hypothetical protein
MQKIFFSFFILIFLSGGSGLFAQPVPAGDENIPYLVTFGPRTGTSWGDDDFSQTFFFLVPKDYKGPVYIRIYDPDVGGDIDEINGVWDTRTKFCVYGGKGAWSDPDAQEVDPRGNYRSGNLLATRTFGLEPQWDRKWFTFGPFNPTEGEFSEQFDGHIFKIIAEGVQGDDGNLYRYFLSTSGTQNVAIEGANAFAYEYTFRMHDNPFEVSHIYPYLDDRVISLELALFDWDSDGIVRIISPEKLRPPFGVSADDVWITHKIPLDDTERNTSIDIQFHKRKDVPVRNNNVVVYVRNQYGELLPFFVIPIGGVPKYKYSIGVRPKRN